MKKFRQFTEELISEGGGDSMPADDMTISELKIACYAAQNILDRLENGGMVQRWQISAIVKAKEELASVYTSMSADEVDTDDDSDEMDWDDDQDTEEPFYVGFEYPSMYGEAAEAKYVVKGKSPFYKGDHYINTHETPKAQLIKKHIKHATRMDLETAKKVAKDWESHPNKYKIEVVPVNEETELDEGIKGKEYHVVHKAASLTSAQMKAPVPGDQPTFHKSQEEALDHLNKKYKKVRDGVWKNAKGEFFFHKKKVMGESVELDEASDLRITKVYNKSPKKATYAVHSPDRKYYKEFDSMEAAKAHRSKRTEAQA